MLAPDSFDWATDPAPMRGPWWEFDHRIDGELVFSPWIDWPGRDIVCEDDKLVWPLGKYCLVGVMVLLSSGHPAA